ncbi:MAG: ParB/RepB/Spo0J family partition protein [Deltaproteobacteria bacterium]|nr:ParB/RepB/Spo0J family partition protein [Deltaproteobacteria bacterium]
MEIAQEKRRGLGRGLSALIPPKPTEESATSRGALQLPLEEVLPGDGQPRQRFDEARLAELADSIKAHGIIQPILVRRRGGQYEIVAGERRWRAAQQAGLKSIPAVVSDVAEKDALTIALVENLQREDLNPIEEAEAFHRLHEQLGYSQQEIADAVGKDRATVANSLRLLKLPGAVRTQVLDGELSMGHARAILALDEPDEMERLGREVVAKRWSVRQTERAAQPTQSRRKGSGRETEAERDVRQRLQRALGTRVDVHHKNGKGTVVMHFASYAELEGLLQRLGA